MERLLALRLASVLVAPLLGCVSISAAQRKDEELTAKLASSSWKTRCAAARTCGKELTPKCFEQVERLMVDDVDERVQVCALEGVAARCDRGETAERVNEARDALGRVAWLPADRPPGVLFLHAFNAAVAVCPSADAVMTLASSGAPPALETVRLLGVGSASRPGEPSWTSFLDALAKLPPPRSRVREALEETPAFRELANAQKALQADDVTAFALLREAERLGADVTPLQPAVDRLKQKLAEQHLAKARKLEEAGKPEEAEAERREAEEFGGSDPALEQAIIQSLSALNERKSKDDAAARRLQDERDRWTQSLAQGEQERKAQAAKKRGGPRCALVSGTITQKLEDGRYEFLVFNGFRKVPMIIASDVPLPGVGDYTFPCAFKTGSVEVTLRNGFTAVWEVWKSDSTRRWDDP